MSPNHGLEFNAAKTQLICFHKSTSFPVSIEINGQPLHLSDEVTHLGHILTINLCDGRDILRVTRFQLQVKLLTKYLQLC